MTDKRASRGNPGKQVADVAASIMGEGETESNEKEEQHNSIRAHRGGSREEGSQQRRRNRADAKRRAEGADYQVPQYCCLSITHSAC